MSKERTDAALVFIKPERLQAPNASAHAQAGDTKTMSESLVVVGIDVRLGRAMNFSFTNVPSFRNT